MLENITQIDFKIISLYVRDYNVNYSIREITNKLNINYSHAFKRVKELVRQKILKQEKEGQVNHISLNIKDLNTIKFISFVEENQKVKNTTLEILAKEAIKIDINACIGIFGSRVSGKATKSSDWDVFIISDNQEMKKIMAKIPYETKVQLQVISVKEFQDSLLSPEETIIKHIIRNKQIIYNAYPFYNLVYNWELIKHVPKI